MKAEDLSKFYGPKTEVQIFSDLSLEQFILKNSGDHLDLICRLCYTVTSSQLSFSTLLSIIVMTMEHRCKTSE